MSSGIRESKLFHAIEHLNGHEINKLSRFLSSPYFNQNQNIIRLFDWIRQELKSDVASAASKEDIWNAVVLPTENFNDSRYRKLQSDLLSLIQEFFAQEQFQKNPAHKAKYLLDSVRDRDIPKLKKGALKTAQLLTKGQEDRPASYYYYKYEIEQGIYELNRQDLERNTKSNIEQIAQNLDRFYLAEKLRYYCTILNHQLLASLNYEMLFMDEIIKHVQSNDYSDVAPIQIYYQILLTYHEPDKEEHYAQLKALINKYIDLFPESEAKEIIDAALNYSIKKVNTGNEKYSLETFLLYKESLERGLLHVHNKLSPWSFKNIVTAGLRLSEFDWVENFINHYSLDLDPKARQNAVTFNLAQLYFYKKDYPSVISQLSQVEYEDTTYNLNSKTLLMASYYELDEFEALNSLLDTFRVYLNRNQKIPETRRKHYLNTISIVRKLARIKPKDTKAIEQLRKELQQTQGIVSKNWIQEKLDMLQ